MSRKAKGLLSLLLVGVLTSVVGFGVFAAFSSTTTNPNNQFDAGTVVIADNDAGSAMYNVTNQKPGGAATASCIKVTYSGSLDADVKLYTASTIGALGPYVNLTIEAGTQASPSFPSCTGFVADAGGPLFSGTLTAFSAAHNSYATGLADYPGTSATKWVTSDAVAYRYTVALDAAAPDTVQGGTTGLHAHTWEARNQ